MSVSVVGAGRLGTALAIALNSRGYKIEALVARRLERAKKAKELSGTGALALSAAQLARLPTSDLILLTVPDDCTPAIARELVRHQRPIQAHRSVLHTSGALSSSVLAPLAKVGFHLGSMHPLVSISDPSTGAANLQEAFFCLEGGGRAVKVARKIVHDLGGHAFTIAAARKPLYHAAALMASGHMVALFDLAQEMLTQCGLSDRQAREVLLPLMKSTVVNLATKKPARALTGTFARADVETAQRHLAALEDYPAADALTLYRLLGQRSLGLVRRHLDHQHLEQISQLLKNSRKRSKR